MKHIVRAGVGVGVVLAGLVGGSAGVRAVPSPFGSCRILPADNVWNTRIDSLPVDANSAAYVSAIGSGAKMHADFGSGVWPPPPAAGFPIGIPFTTVPGNQPAVPVVFQYASESDPGPYPIPPNAPIEGDPNSGDRHVLVVDTGHCKLYEMFDSVPVNGGSSWTAGSGAVFDLNSDALRPSTWTSADAAGLPILPGLVRYDEVANGAIHHAIRFTAPVTAQSFIWPARHQAGSSSGIVPMGERFRLKNNYDISHFSVATQVILTALKNYGMILADNGSPWYISGVPDPSWDNSVLHELGNVPGSAFEAVDESSLMLNVNSGQAKQPGGPPLIAIDSPQPSPPVSGTVLVSGWAVDPSAVATAGTGIDQVHLYRDGYAGQGGVFITGVSYGSARPDVASYLGNAQFTNAGYSYSWNVSGLSPGVHSAVVYAHSLTQGWAVATRAFTVPAPLIAIDAPQPSPPVFGSVLVSGWAVDPLAGTGTGIDQVHLYRDGYAGAGGVFIAGMNYGSARSDVASYLGNAQFTNSGYSYTWYVSGLSPGAHTAMVYAHSQARGWAVATRTFTVYVPAPLIAIDSPQPAQTASGSLLVSGWAVDPSAAAGTGIDQVHLYRDGYAGAGGVFVAGMNYGSARPDVASYLGNAQFTNAGYSCSWTISGLSPGMHTVVVYAHSVTQGWAVTTRTFTVQAGTGGSAVGKPAAAATPMPVR